MKKFLSLVLVLTMALSLLSILPASASGSEELQIGAEKISFAEFVQNYDAKYAASEITLLADVDATVLPAPLATPFTGTLNGGDKAINNLSVPLFNTLSGAIVKDLTVNGSIGTAAARVETGVHFGGIAINSTGETTLQNVVSNVDLYVSVTANAAVGGVVGNLSAGKLNMISCANNGTLNLLGSGNVQIQGGAFVGTISAAGCEFNATACVNNGDVIASSQNWCNIGGFCGRIEVNASNMTLKKCVNTGDIGFGSVEPLGSKYRAGGFGGSMRTNETGVITMQYCLNLGNINVKDTAGGMIGENQGQVFLMNCYNYGNVGDTSYDGGLVGLLNKTAACNYSIQNCVHAPSDAAAAALIGQISAGQLVFDGNVLVGTPEASAVELGHVVTKGNKTENFSYSGMDSTSMVADRAAWEAATPEIDVIGYQKTAVDTATNTFKVRIVTTVSSLAYDAVGFEIIRSDANGAGAIVKTTTKAYSSLLGNDGTVYDPAAEKDGAEYFVPFVIEGVPADGSVTFHVRPYVVEGDVVTYGETMLTTFASAAA